MSFTNKESLNVLILVLSESVLKLIELSNKSISLTFFLLMHKSTLIITNLRAKPPINDANININIEEEIVAARIDVILK